MNIILQVAYSGRSVACPLRFNNKSCHQRKMFTCVIVSVFTLLVVPIANASPDGAPTQACGSMTPQHGEVPQTSTSPFQTEIPVGAYVLMDDPVQLELRASAGTTFKGFLIMAFDKDDDTRPIGTFKEPVDGQLLNCTDGFMNAVTHTNNTEKSLVKIEWQPPLYYMGTAVFRTTFVQNAKTYWVKTESIGVSFVMEIPSSASQSITTWTGLIIALLLAVLIQ
ncbi:putative defense protein [Daphnia carinata]|uniref:putative defense protein n=1 Tax=Daphnia carinata TaxID=120202 RepID=UPI0028688DA1|nr:putative defense protein [Daphnia carinata]